MTDGAFCTLFQGVLPEVDKTLKEQHSYSFFRWPDLEGEWKESRSAN